MCRDSDLLGCACNGIPDTNDTLAMLSVQPQAIVAHLPMANTVLRPSHEELQATFEKFNREMQIGFIQLSPCRFTVRARQIVIKKKVF